MQEQTVDIDEVPDIETEIAVHGSVEQVEVGGELCATIAYSIYLYHHD